MRKKRNMNAKVFTLDSDSSNSMKSGNPHSGIHEAFFAKTLDTTLTTDCDACSIAVVQNLEGVE